MLLNLLTNEEVMCVITSSSVLYLLNCEGPGLL